MVQDDQVSLRVLRDRQCLPEIHRRRVLQEIRHGNIGDFGPALLGGHRRGENHESYGDNETFHGNLLEAQLPNREPVTWEQWPYDIARDAVSARSAGCCWLLHSCLLSLLLRTLVRSKDAFAKTNIARGHLNQFVVVDELDRLFQVQQARRH